MAPGEDTDSGMESQESSMMEPHRCKANRKRDEADAGAGAGTGTGTVVGTNEFSPDDKPDSDDPYSDESDETLSERLWGLTEMFPESVRNATYAVAMTTKSSIKTFYGFSRSAFWVVFSSSIILFAPVIFEVERVQMEEAQRTQQKQMLLGPNTAVSGGGMPIMPPLHR